MDAFTSRFGTRFLVVTLLPNIFLFGYVTFLIAAGAPEHSLSLSRALALLDHLTAYGIVAIFLGVIAVSVAIHPLQVPLIQLIEGYWWAFPFGQNLRITQLSDSGKSKLGCKITLMTYRIRQTGIGPHGTLQAKHSSVGTGFQNRRKTCVPQISAIPCGQVKPRQVTGMGWISI